MTQEDELKELYKRGWYGNLERYRHLRWNYTLWYPHTGESAEEAIEAYCRSFLKVVPDKRIVGADGSPYLDRYCLAEPLGMHKGDLTGKIYLNHFWRSDADQELHSHPWDRSTSLILVNGYEEERREGSEIRRFDRRPGDVVTIDAETFHRVELPRGDAWTLFFVGRYVGTWYFWNRATGVQEQWEDFLRGRARRS